ncbi:chorismate-binding protein [Actinokineospora sp. PR83]|uniref:anthranilate synthase component I family protein n=1 Tax=Actinokineospora sp. PR83 TaxID=2884908 RepID=UPI001F19334E|nr:chorismate-binding protein [Actinokineospora sp. PR83]MCG8917241.1 chorismate-binding protein [Actinokineospora sp. PR83]
MTTVHHSAATTGTAVPGPAEVADLAEHYEWVPVFRELLVEGLSPTSAFDRLCGPGDTGFLLESVPVGGDVGRYSYLGYRPRPLDLPEGDPLPALAEVAGRSVAPVAGLPPFSGGAVGYLGYEAARHFERLPRAAGPGPGVPESAFLAADDLVVFDHATRSVVLVTLHRPAGEPYEAALGRLSDLQDRLTAEPPSTVLTATAKPPGGVRPDDGWASNTTQAEFEERVRRAREHIAAGDAFQIVLSQRFTRPLRVEPAELYRHLRAVNPSPYLYHLSLGGGRHVIGASPELLVRADGRTVRTRPLAGTRARGSDHEGDLALERDLLTDSKERAEHVMLVDLGRHDISRVCVPGTVRVERLMEVERFSHVMHLSSTVAGELTDGATPLDALRAAFPAGTLSGAPKIRAMELIAEMEPDRRGVYGGALGCVGFGGLVDFAIGLRTLVVADDLVHVQAGAGVVADSDPTAEYLETLHKANALFTAVRSAEEAR